MSSSTRSTSRRSGLRLRRRWQRAAARMLASPAGLHTQASGQRRACRWSAASAPPLTIPRTTITSSRGHRVLFATRKVAPQIVIPIQTNHAKPRSEAGAYPRGYSPTFSCLISHDPTLQYNRLPSVTPTLTKSSGERTPQNLHPRSASQRVVDLHRSIVLCVYDGRGSGVQ